MNLYPVRKADKYGYMDGEGNVVIDFEFDQAAVFSEGLARVRVDKKWGYIDTDSNLIIAPTFDRCLEFSEGRAVVCLEGKWGYIYYDGVIAIQPRFYQCHDFCGGIARVQSSIRSRGEFIDKSGAIVLSGRNYLLSHHSEGLINCPDKGKWGYLKPDDTFAIPPQYLYARPFHEGLAAVSSENEGFFHFIDRENKVVIRQQFEGTDIRFSEGFCAVWDKLYGFINTAGDLAIPYRFQYAGHFSEGLARVKLPDSPTYGYVDSAGRLAIPPAFTHADPFKQGLAQVIVGETYETYNYGYINRLGEYVWYPSR